MLANVKAERSEPKGSLDMEGQRGAIKIRG